MKEKGARNNFCKCEMSKPKISIQELEKINNHLTSYRFVCEAFSEQ